MMGKVTQLMRVAAKRPTPLAGLRKRCEMVMRSLLAALSAFIFSGMINSVEAQPTMVDPNLSVRTVTTGLTEPTGMAFLGTNDFLVLEKSTGKVQRVVDGVIQGAVLDLAVNFASERGLLGIALHPDFANNGFVYLYWTCRGAEAAEECGDLFGADTGDLAEVPLLGNRVDRFVWDESTLTFSQNIIRLRSYQADAEQPLRGNHNGGRIIFGPDGKLYIFIGDNGRRGQLQNLPDGPFGPGEPDDQFGGPEPDNAHLTGVILRLNDDGTAPEDNPFFDVGAKIDGEVGANIQKIFSYGHRNSFGLAFDPLSGNPGNLWLQENADDAFTEINLVKAGMNGGWVQIMGPVERIAEFKAIETSDEIDPVTGTSYHGLQQVRWPPTLIADTPEEALSRLFVLPGSFYEDPKLRSRYEIT